MSIFRYLIEEYVKEYFFIKISIPVNQKIVLKTVAYTRRRGPWRTTYRPPAFTLWCRYLGAPAAGPSVDCWARRRPPALRRRHGLRLWALLSASLWPSLPVLACRLSRSLFCNSDQHLPAPTCSCCPNSVMVCLEGVWFMGLIQKSLKFMGLKNQIGEIFGTKMLFGAKEREVSLEEFFLELLAYMRPTISPLPLVPPLGCIH